MMATAFLDNFGKEGASKAILISGPPGSGKTHLVDYIAEQRGLEIVMLNASDERTKNALRHVKTIAMTQEGSPLIIVLDECDAMKSQEIMKFIEITKVPLFLTCNFIDKIDYKVHSMCQMIKIKPPSWWDFENYMKILCENSGILINPENLTQLAKRAKSFRHAERLVFDPNDEDPEIYEMQYQTIERMLRGDNIDHIDIQPAELNTCIFDAVGNAELASNVDIILEHAFKDDYRFWSYAYGILESVRSNVKVEPKTRTFVMMGEAKKKHKAEVTAESKAFEKATETIKVDVSKMNTAVVETGGGVFNDDELMEFIASASQTNEGNTTQTNQTEIGDWI